MICISIYRNHNGAICGFEATNHGRDIVCAAVSAVTLNAVNSIEAFTDAVLRCEYEENGGYLKLLLPDIENGQEDHDAELLLKSMALALEGIQKEHGKQIRIKYIRK